MKRWLCGIIAFVLSFSCLSVLNPTIKAETNTKTGTNVDAYYYGTGSTICYSNAVWEENLTVEYGHKYGRVVSFENCESAAIRTLSAVAYKLDDLHIGIEDFTGEGLRFMISGSGTSVETDPGLVVTVQSGVYLKVTGKNFSNQVDFTGAIPGKTDIFTDIQADGSLIIDVAGVKVTVPATAVTENFTDKDNIYVQFFALTDENIGTMSFNFTTIHNGDCETGNIVNNKALTPKYVPDSQVTVDENGSPDWLSQLVIAEVKIAAASPERNFKGAMKLLDLYQEMGVNGIWLTPIYDGYNFNDVNAGYANHGPHTVNPNLTGTDDYEEGWQVVKNFIDEAHKRNIRVFLDAISWGVSFASPLITEHPDWFNGEAWGGAAYDWSNEEFKNWYVSTWVDNIMTTGADGLRCDCEPGYSGYDVYKEIRHKLADQGRKIAIMSEHTNTRGAAEDYTYDFEQFGVNASGTAEYNMDAGNVLFLKAANLARACTSGKYIGNIELQNVGTGGSFKYYTFMLSNHDHRLSCAKGSRTYVGYQAILAPFIPLWLMGEEWNDNSVDGIQYCKKLNWDKLYQYENRSFFEDYKKYIAIRWTYPEIFGYFPENHRETNIAMVKPDYTTSTSIGAPYARFGGGKAVIVAANQDATEKTVTYTIPYRKINLEEADEYQVKDLMTGEILAVGSSSEMTKFTATMKADHVGIYLIEARQGSDPRPGDFNGDGRVTTTDYILIKKAVQAGTNLPESTMAAADVNGNGALDSGDYLKVKAYFQGRIDEL